VCYLCFLVSVFVIFFSSVFSVALEVKFNQFSGYIPVAGKSTKNMHYWMVSSFFSLPLALICHIKNHFRLNPRATLPTIPFRSGRTVDPAALACWAS
jgi:hypothetical protein